MMAHAALIAVSDQRQKLFAVWASIENQPDHNQHCGKHSICNNHRHHKKGKRREKPNHCTHHQKCENQPTASLENHSDCTQCHTPHDDVPFRFIKHPIFCVYGIRVPMRLLSSKGQMDVKTKRKNARLLTSAFIFLDGKRYHGFNMMISCTKYCS